MRVTSIELRRIAIPLLAPFRAAHGTEDERDVLLVRTVTDDGVEGWGECVALGQPTYSDEHVAGAHALIRDQFAPAVIGRELDAAEVYRGLAFVPGQRMAKAAVEAAVLDAELRRSGKSLAEHLGATRPAVPAGVAVGLHDTVDDLVAAVSGYVAQGYVRVKVKIQPGWDVEPLAALRSSFPDLPLQADANGSYELADAAHLAGLDRFDLLLIEQPLGEHDLAGHAALARRIATPVCLDESLASFALTVTALDIGACSVVCLKPGRVGGYHQAKRIHDLCVERGVPLWCGGMLETGIGRAGNVALAALPGFTLPGDLSASDRYYQRDVTRPFVLTDGTLTVPTGPGIGVEPDLDYVDALTTAVEVVRG